MLQSVFKARESKDCAKKKLRLNFKNSFRPWTELFNLITGVWRSQLFAVLPILELTSHKSGVDGISPNSFFYDYWVELIRPMDFK